MTPPSPAYVTIAGSGATNAATTRTRRSSQGSRTGQTTSQALPTQLTFKPNIGPPLNKLIGSIRKNSETRHAHAIFCIFRTEAQFRSDSFLCEPVCYFYSPLLCWHKPRCRSPTPSAWRSARTRRLAGTTEGARASAARIAQARAGMLPKINYSESFARSDNPVFVFSSLLTQHQFGPENFAIGPLNRPDFLNNFQSLVTVDQPIYDAGQTRNAVKSAELAQKMTCEEQRLRADERHLPGGARLLRRGPRGGKPESRRAGCRLRRGRPDTRRSGPRRRHVHRRRCPVHPRPPCRRDGTAHRPRSRRGCRQGRAQRCARSASRHAAQPDHAAGRARPARSRAGYPGEHRVRRPPRSPPDPPRRQPRADPGGRRTQRDAAASQLSAAHSKPIASASSIAAAPTGWPPFPSAGISSMDRRTKPASPKPATW